MYKRLNETGKIPKFTECPYKEKCGSYQMGHCHHHGQFHEVEFSCGAARAFDLMEVYKDKGDVKT